MGMTMLQRIEHSKRLEADARRKAQRRRAFEAALAHGRRGYAMRIALEDQGATATSGTFLGSILTDAMRKGSSSSHG